MLLISRISERMVLFILKQNSRKIWDYFRHNSTNSICIWYMDLFICLAYIFYLLYVNLQLSYLYAEINDYVTFPISNAMLIFLFFMLIITEEWRHIINWSPYLSRTTRVKLRDCKLGWHNKMRLYVPLGKWGTKPSCVYGARDTGPPLVIILNEMKLVQSTHAVDNKTSVAVACFEVPRIFHITAILVLHWRSCRNTFVPFEIGNSYKYLPLASAENFTIARNYI